MPVINSTLPFSASNSSMPIAITATSAPGTLIHTSPVGDQDFVWLWTSVSTFVPYTKVLCVQLMRGNSTVGYEKDAFLTMPLNSRTLVDNGILITGGVELRAYIVTELSTAPVDALPIITGYVHRRTAS